MRPRRARIPVVLASVAAAIAVAPAVAEADVMTATNGSYTVGVDSGQFSLYKGRFAVSTGAAHPLGGGRPLLYGISAPQQSFVSVHSYTTGSDYLQGPVGAGAPANVYSLSPLMTVSPIGSTGVHTSAPEVNPDRLTVETDAIVHGSTPADSIVELTTRVHNDGASPLKVGVRYLLDTQVGLDDGPVFQPIGTGAPFSTNEAGFADPAFTSWRVRDNGRNASSPTYDVLGSAAGPVGLGPTPRPPTLVQFDCFQSARDTPFGYAPDDAYDISTSQSTCGPLGANGDSAVALYWGDQSTNAFSIPAGESIAVTSLLAAAPPDGGFSDTAPPTSELAGAGCTPTGELSFRVLDAAGGTGARAIHTRVDGGPEQATETAGDGPGVAAVTLAEGTHTVEYWGEDRSGNQEPAHHTASVVVDQTHPTVSIASDQGTSRYLRGAFASATTTADDTGSGLGIDPSAAHERLPTDRTGEQTVSKTARDRCGNLWTSTFAYTVSVAVARDFFALDSSRECTGRRRLKIRLRAPSGETIVALTVRLNGRVVKRLSGSALKSTVRLTKVPTKRTKVLLEARTRSGSTFTFTRTYAKCPKARKRPSRFRR